MTRITKIFAGGASLAVLATAAPATAQWYGYGYNPAAATQIASQQCAAAVQARLNSRAPSGILGVLGLLGVSQNTGRVLSITQVVPRRSTIRVTGLATSNRHAGYGPYGVGAYGAYGYGYAQPVADLRFRCSVDYRGFVRDVDIMRR
jgi:hypothetical protein